MNESEKVDWADRIGKIIGIGIVVWAALVVFGIATMIIFNKAWDMVKR